MFKALTESVDAAVLQQLLADHSLGGVDLTQPDLCLTENASPAIENIQHGEQLQVKEQSSTDRYEQALRSNLKYRRQLMNVLMVIDEKIEEAHSFQVGYSFYVESSSNGSFVQRQIVGDAMSRRKFLNPRNLIGFPPFVDVAGEQPPDNPDVDMYKTLMQTVPAYHDHRPWMKEETLGLKQAALTLSRIMDIKAKQISGQGISEFERDNMAAELERKSQLTGFRSLSCGILQIDWDALARNFVKTRTGDECRIRWFSHDDPRINKSDEWPTEETKKLLELSIKYQGRNWVAIARELGTNRTPMQCFQRYQRSHNPSIIKQEFTKEEDKKLLELVQQHGFNWEVIALSMHGRTASQCNHRYNNTAIQTIKSGRWTPREDVQLILAKKAFEKWTQIADYVPGRTGMKCRERFSNVLDPDCSVSKNRHWTPEEDDKLFELVRIHGAGNWAKISEAIGDRTDNQCYRRWRNCAEKRSPEEYAEYKKRLSLKRKHVLGNFVGRKKNRPKVELDALDIPEGDQNSDDSGSESQDESECMPRDAKKPRVENIASDEITAS
jgi:hypothetical protein